MEHPQQNYRDLYLKLVRSIRQLHKDNERRLRRGLWSLLIVPIVFLVMMLVTRTSKIFFLILWIASLFVIGGILILLEYLDYRMMQQVRALLPEEAWPDTPLLEEARLDLDAQKQLSRLEQQLQKEKESEADAVGAGREP